MSKAVTNEEVEDVLSSIRRLVSEDKRPLAGLRAAQPASVQQPDTITENAASGLLEEADADHAPQAEISIAAPSDVAGRLVLTPALRVADEPEPAVEPEVSPEQERLTDPIAQQDQPDDGPLDLGSVARETWTVDEDAREPGVDEATVADAKAYRGPMVLFPAAQETVSDDARDAAMEALDALVHEAIEADATATTAQDDEPLEDGDYSDEDYWTDDETDEEPTDAKTAYVGMKSASAYVWDEEDFLSDRIDPSGRADDMVQENREPGNADKTELNSDEIEALADDATEAFGEEAAAIEAQGNDTIEAFEQESDVRETVSSDRSSLRSASVTQMPLTAKIAALEAAIGKIATGWEPDGDERDELAVPDAPAMAWEDDVDLDAKGVPFVKKTAAPEESAPEEKDTSAADAQQSDAAQQAGTGFGVDDQLMDEEALRDLVAEIVRSELQGALGERITRNVRKLVRREIHRALTAHEME